MRALLVSAAILVLGVVPALAADLVSASPNCRPAAPQRGSNCTKDSQCCAGLVCQSGACRSGCRVGGAFYAEGAKSPSNACLSCQPSVSTTSFTAVAEGGSCSDGNACTQTDTCSGGVCRGASPVTCSAQDQCHTAGTCNPSTGLCSNPSKANGALCDDANACTRTDSCQSGVCRGASPVTCTAQDACHSAGTCDPATGVCSNPAKANGTTCSDVNACTRRDTCQAGVCTGSNPVICQSSDQCRDPGTCDPATGACSSPNKADGTPCSDGNACTTGDQCRGGICTGPAVIFCIAPDACHDGGTCNPQNGQCSFPPKPNGTACNDGTACTGPDTCQSGVCTGANPVVCGAAPDQCHQDGVCDAATGVCNPPKPDGTACDDGNACTLADRCLAGVCTPQGLSICFNADACHENGTCDPATGLCSHPPRPDGTACNDGNACTSQDSCQAGACTGAAPVICGLPGTCHGAGSCDPTTGQCVYPNLPNGTVCSDGNGCSVGDTCQNGSCVGSVIVCPTGLPSACYTGISDCNPANGQCVPRPVTNGTACNDGDSCTSADSCQAGVCTGTPCAAGFECCSDGGAPSCKDMGFDNANCGTCGHACVDSACLRGQCVDGCVIGGVGYGNGVHNPGNDCQLCDVSFSRTAWKPLGDATHFPICTAGGCASGFCQAGTCFINSQGGGCPSNACAAGSCNGASCSYTPINEGGSCTPSLSTNPCRSSSVGTCHSGQCVGANLNEDQACMPEGPVYGTAHECRSVTTGSCVQGSCVNDILFNGTVCHQVDDPGRGLCFVGECEAGDCGTVTTIPGGNCNIPSYCGEDGTCDRPTGQCVYPPHDPYPSGGSINCNVNGEFTADPSKCCPGQVCICPPVPAGIPQFCLRYECWDPADIPHGYQDAGLSRDQ